MLYQRSPKRRMGLEPKSPDCSSFLLLLQPFLVGEVSWEWGGPQGESICALSQNVLGSHEDS